MTVALLASPEKDAFYLFHFFFLQELKKIMKKIVYGTLIDWTIHDRKAPVSDQLIMLCYSISRWM